MGRLAALAILAGLLLGPVYFFVVQFGSGTKVATFLVVEGGRFVLSPETVRTSAEDAKVDGAIAFDAEPTMNPIAVIATARYRNASPGARCRFDAALHQEGDLLWEDTVVLGVRRSSKNSEAFSRHETSRLLHRFDVERTSAVTLTFERTGLEALSLSELSIDVRRNSIAPSPAVYVTGLVLLVAGLGMLVVVIVRHHRRTTRSPASA